MRTHCLVLCSVICALSASAFSQTSSSGGAYTSVTFGNGTANGPYAVDDNSMKWRAFEVRFGEELQDSLNGTGLRFDVIHYNEGHADNNHRDGFGTQLVVRKAFNETFSVEAGAGPYFSMNTTKIDGEEYDDPRLGAMVTLAVLANMNRLSPGLHMRFAVNHVDMPGAASSNAFLIGLDKDFDPVYSRGREDSGQNPVWYGVMVGDSKTNHGGTESAIGYSVEAKEIFDSRWAASVAAINEGDDGSRVDRKGVAVQGWFIQPLNDKWTASAGVGPYVAKNRRDSGGLEMDGLITIQVERSVGKNWKIFANFNRVASFRRNNDRDMGRIGVSRKFN